MKKKIVTIVLLVTTLSFVGCGAEMTNANKENAQVEEGQEVEAIESNGIAEGDMVSEESTVFSEDVSSTSAMVEEKEPWNGVYGENDAPGLTNIDWDAFNGYMYAEQVTFLGDENLEINVLQVLGSDPRINNDWSALNEKFDTLYGNSEHGMAKFVQDVVLSYNYSSNFILGFSNYAILYIEPYRSNTDNGVYGGIVEDEIDNQEAYDAWKDAREQEAEQKQAEIEAAREKEDEEWLASLSPEERAEELYRREMAGYKDELSALCNRLWYEGIYTIEISNQFEDFYDLLDWLIEEGHLSDPDGKYRECIDYYGSW
ncbi:MAG: hypothetical protein IJX99_09760 [Clostridia bacterium]|nr:hypothetical protein [Clostridia bacterium]